MEIVDLVGRDRRSLEYSESGVREDALMRLTRRPVFSCHVTVVGGGSAPGEAVAMVIGAHAVETIATRQLPFEVIDAGEFGVGYGSLVVTAIFVEPRNGIGARAAVGWSVVLRDGRGTALRCGLSVQ